MAGRRLSRAGVDCDDVVAQQQAMLSAPQRADVAARMTSWPAARSHLTAFLLFVGYSRSGHTLVGSLLDGHPNAIIGNEYGALARWEGRIAAVVLEPQAPSG